MPLDLDFVRSQFPAFAVPALEGQAFFENAGGSYACRQTIDALTRYYTETKVQPYAAYEASARAGEAMDRSRARWAEALGVAPGEVNFGPSTTMNCYVLAQAFGESLGPGDEVIVTNQDHEANTGAVRRMVKRAGATLREWRVNPGTGLLDPDDFAGLLTERTRLVTFPHCSNIAGQENDVKRLSALAHEAGARVVVDAVSFAPHTFADVGDLGPDVYLFSLYKTYSVHQGLMVVRKDLAEALPNQGHFFNEGYLTKRLTPAGPDHAQEAAAGAVLDYVEAVHAHHGGTGTSLREACGAVSALWREHETRLAAPVLDWLEASPHARLIGASRSNAATGHRCPTIAFVPDRDPKAVADALVARGIMTSSGHYYARRLVEALGIDAARGVVRVSFVHYTSPAEVDRLVRALDEVLGGSPLPRSD